MERYRLTRMLGDGTYGSVYAGVHVATGEVVAVKQMKAGGSGWADALRAPEVVSLRRLNHPHIVQLREVIRERDGRLFYVFEYLDLNLYEAIKERADAGRPFAAGTVRTLLWQLLQALASMHRTHFHRDIKPENCLLRRAAGATTLVAAASAGLALPPAVLPGLTGSGGDLFLKLADFGLAREARSRPPYTEYVSTRWYRAPEVLLRFPAYSSPVDIFAVGCIAVEMFNLAPLAPGASEVDQLAKLCAALGTPTPTTWPAGVRQVATLGVRLPAHPVPNLHDLLPTAPPDAVSLIGAMLAWDPARRPSASAALAHPFFTAHLALPAYYPPLPPAVADALAAATAPPPPPPQVVVQAPAPAQPTESAAAEPVNPRAALALLRAKHGGGGGSGGGGAEATEAPPPSSASSRWPGRAAAPAAALPRNASRDSDASGSADIDALIDDYLASRDGHAASKTSLFGTSRRGAAAHGPEAGDTSSTSIDLGAASASPLAPAPRPPPASPPGRRPGAPAMTAAVGGEAATGGGGGGGGGSSVSFNSDLLTAGSGSGGLVFRSPAAAVAGGRYAPPAAPPPSAQQQHHPSATRRPVPAPRAAPLSPMSALLADTAGVVSPPRRGGGARATATEAPPSGSAAMSASTGFGVTSFIRRFGGGGRGSQV